MSKDFKCNQNFSEALENLKQGEKLQRSGWNGKDMWIALSEPNEKSASGIHSYINADEPFQTLPFIVMKTADGKLVPWLASQTDILADDYIIF